MNFEKNKKYYVEYGYVSEGFALDESFTLSGGKLIEVIFEELLDTGFKSMAITKKDEEITIAINAYVDGVRCLNTYRIREK